MPPSNDPLPPLKPTFLDAPPLSSPPCSSQGGPSTVKKRLFSTPGTSFKSNVRSHDTSQTPIPHTPNILNQPITNCQHHFRPLQTPTPSTSSRAPRPAHSALRYAALDATPTLRRKYHVDNPGFWRTVQSNDLTAWLNSVLVPQPLGSSGASQPLSTHVHFRQQLCAMANLYKHSSVAPVLAKVDAEISAGRFFISRKIRMATHHEFRDKLVEILLLNYHPMWLLLALSVVLSRNLAYSLDDAFQQLSNRPAVPDHDHVFMAVLEDSLRNVFLKDHVPHPGVSSSLTPNSSKTASRTPDSAPKDPFNAIVLSRVLHLVLLLDNAKKRKPFIISTDPPLFRFRSNISSSKEVIVELQKHFLLDQGDVPRFLSFRGYDVTYVTPLFERSGLKVQKLDKDLRDGVRLCKVASLLTKDPLMVTKIRRERIGMSKKELFSCRLGNVRLAMSKMQEYAESRLSKGPKWKASNADIVKGDVDKTIAVLWQISSLWLQINVLDHASLSSELKKVEQEFREAKKLFQEEKWSPGGTPIVPVDEDIASSPSGLTVYENCDTKVGFLLLRWCAVVAGMYGIAVRDFTESFRDAAPLCVILYHYCPDLIKKEEFCRVNQAHLRSVKDSEMESQIVQENFDLFTSRVRSLGDIPDIQIRSEAALAEPFVKTEKNESFGRIMELLSSYLFRRLTQETENGESLLLPKCFLMRPEFPPPSPLRHSATPGRSNTPGSQRKSSKLISDSRDRELTEETQLRSDEKNYQKKSPFPTQPSSNPGSTSLSGIEVAKGRKSGRKPRENGEHSNLNVDGGQISTSEGDSRDLYSVPKVSSVDDDESKLLASQKDAARVILGLYRAKKRQRDFQTKRDSVVTVQACFRGHVIREDVKTMMRTRSITGLREALDIYESNNSEEEFVSAKSSPMYNQDLARAPYSHKGRRAMNGTEIVLDRSALLLPLLRDHMQGMKEFSARMVLHEQTQASLAVQKSLRAHMAAREAVISTSGGIERELSTMPWLRLTSGAFRIARSIAYEIHSDVELQRKEAINFLSSRLRSGEDAYEREMSLCEDKRMYETSRRKEFLARMRTHSEDDVRAALVLQDDMIGLDRDEVDLNSRFAEASAIPGSDNDSIHSGDLSDLEVVSERVEVSDEPSREGNVRMENTEDHLSMEKLLLSAEWDKLKGEHQSILDDIRTIQTELSSNFKARDEELQRWKGVVLTAALFKSEYEFDSYMLSADTARERYAEKRSACAAEKIFLQEENSSLKITEEDELRALSESLDVLESRCSHAEEEANRKFVNISNRICFALKTIEDLDAIQERESRASICSVIQEKSLEAEVSRFKQDWEEFDSYRKAAKCEQQRLDETIEKLDQEELEKESEEKLHYLLERAEMKYIGSMSNSLAMAKKHEIAREEHMAKLAAISRDDEDSREHFDESIQSLNNLLTGLDELMEERRSYMRTLSTPANNALISTPGVGSGLKSALNVNSTPGTKCEQLIRSAEGTLNLIDVQRTLPFDDGTQNCESPGSSGCDLDEEKGEKRFFDVGDGGLGATRVEEEQENLIDNLTAEEGAERKTAESNFNRTKESAVENIVDCSNDGSLQGNLDREHLKASPFYDSASPSENECANPSNGTLSSNEKASSRTEDVLCNVNTSCSTAESALGAANASIEEYSAATAVDKVGLIGPDGQTEGSTYSGDLRKELSVDGDQIMRQSSLTQSSYPFIWEAARTEFGTPTVPALSEAEADHVSNPSAGSLRENYDGLSDRGEISDWTNETTRGSPLPEELSPNWTGKTGSSLTSKRSSIRDSNPSVFAPIENQMSNRGSGRGNEKEQRVLSGKQVPGVESNAAPLDESLGQINENSSPEIMHRREDKRMREFNYIAELQNMPSDLLVFCQGYSSPKNLGQVENRLNDCTDKIIGTHEAATFVSSSIDAYVATGSEKSPSSARGATDRWLESASKLGPHSSPDMNLSGALANHTPTAPTNMLSSFLRSNALSSLEKPPHSDLGSVRVPLSNSSHRATTPSSSGGSVLRGLATELRQLKHDINRESSMEKLAMTEKEVQLGSVLRRISIASAAHASQEGEQRADDALEDLSVLNIIRIICTIMQRYQRSKPHVELVHLGISILRDMCRSPDYIGNIFLVQDCLVEIVRCVQFHRDNEQIMVAALEALLAISSHPHGRPMLGGRRGCLQRLRRVNNFLQLQAQRDKVCGERMRKTNIILRAIENRRKNQSRGYFADELSCAAREIPQFKVEARRSVQLLQSLLDNFPSMSEGAA